MKREESGNHQAAPAKSCSTLQQQKEKNGVDGVQQQARVVMASGVQSKERAIESMGEPGQGVPIAMIVSGECPSYGRPSQARSYMRIFGDIAVVVEVQKSIASYRVVAGEHDCDQQQAFEKDCYPRRLK